MNLENFCSAHKGHSLEERNVQLQIMFLGVFFFFSRLQKWHICEALDVKVQFSGSVRVLPCFGGRC